MSNLNMNTLVYEHGNSGDRILAKSFSGHEKNRLFIQSDGNFSDVTLVSGADFPEDGRGFAFVDFDKDGWLDIAVTSPDKPRLRILKNQIPEMQGDTSNNSHLSVQLVGGAKSSSPQTTWSSRDAVGAVVLVDSGSGWRASQKSIGEGLASQNTGYVHLGTADALKVSKVKVLWPSGRISLLNDIPVGQRITISERANSELTLAE